MSQQDYLGKVVAVRTLQGDLVALGQCVGYTDRPTINVNGMDGKQTHWIADLCEVIELPEDVRDAIGKVTFEQAFPATTSLKESK